MLSAMQTRRWVDPSQPQTLQIAVFLLYAQAAVLLLFGAFLSLLGLALIAGGIGAGYGIANEQKWGYSVAVGASILQLLLLFALAGSSTFTALGPLLDLIFYGALVALLLHPMSRDYQRIWFK